MYIEVSEFEFTKIEGYRLKNDNQNFLYLVYLVKSQIYFFNLY